jgi:transcriptional regulator with XRE-family HTH domain
MPQPTDSAAWIAYAESLGVALSSARLRSGQSQERVAHAAGISTFTYRKLEAGQSNPGTAANPRLVTLVALAEVLGIPLRDLLPPDPGSIAPGR